jgi:hypothetical protein
MLGFPMKLFAQSAIGESFRIAFMDEAPTP